MSTGIIEAKYKEELSPLLITCNLNDIVTISTPSIRYNRETLYYLHNPNGDVTQLNITSTEESEEYKNEARIMFRKTNYKIDNVNFGYKIDFKTKDEFGQNGNEFVIGPLMEEDHGNWVLSMYESDDSTWIEMFQVITIEIIEKVPMEPQLPEINPGDTLKLSFAYPIKHLQSCQLTVPSSSYDRYYELASSDWCAYIIRNVTEEDAGTWEVKGVGRIVYEGKTQIKVRNKIT
ncbi:uncharacterized protein isoform X2 [Choristoneura fumiferana]|uniref:uncharacterized protein isoform X2 n=1 Tax=Choristoneura fumiferana TaxID=7141 RepID=UPI003D158E4E